MILGGGTGGRAGRVLPSLLAALVLVGAACDDSEPPDTTAVALANPASVFCEEQGGVVEIVDEADGQRGYCVLPDGTRIDEWEYYREQTGTTTSAPDRVRNQASPTPAPGG